MLLNILCRRRSARTRHVIATKQLGTVRCRALRGEARSPSARAGSRFWDRTAK
jgi:hypothetical protein